MNRTAVPFCTLFRMGRPVPVWNPFSHGRDRHKNCENWSRSPPRDRRRKCKVRRVRERARSGAWRWRRSHTRCREGAAISVAGFHVAMDLMLDKTRRPILPGDLCIATDPAGNAYPGTALRRREGRIVVRVDRGDGELLARAFPPHRVQVVSSRKPIPASREDGPLLRLVRKSSN